MSFQEKDIPLPIQQEILNAATSCTWLGRWKLLIINEEDRRVKVVKAWARRLEKDRAVKGC
jgi:hypothetical protein